MWLVRPTVWVDLQSAVLGVLVSGSGGKSQLDVGVGRQVLGTEQNGEGFVFVVHALLMSAASLFASQMAVRFNKGC